ncbi:uncharacterized protein BJ171DRAFT_419333, partial [Polychytrium aggregatum]|uniref:uncharacterized protein n=1 Tax=Polychytrium aggregatum TaxID=110093 RepID=UPI0022FE2C90
VDQELLRKRAEHNDGELSTLKEVTLHQYDLEKIENLDVYCRHLEQLFLQNNQIMKIENLGKLKELKYLNLALNNITVLENLEGCESLEKLDLTVNFIEDPTDVLSLRSNIHLKELFLIGNPCAEKEGYRSFVVHTLPQIKALDGREIEKTERILAAQEYQKISEKYFAERNKHKSSASIEVATAVAPAHAGLSDVSVPKSTSTSSDLNSPSNVEGGSTISENHRQRKLEEFNTKPVPHSIQTRLEAAREVADMRGDKVRTVDTKPPKPAKSLVGKDGRILQTNEGKWPFSVEYTNAAVVATVQISKFLDSSLIGIDVHPTHIKLTIKGKILQLVFDEEVQPSKVSCERSIASGELVVTMLKVASVDDIIDVSKEIKRKSSEAHRKQFQTATSKTAIRRGRCDHLFMPEEAVDFRNLTRREKTSEPLLAPHTHTAVKACSRSDSDAEDDGVPPLC